MSTHTPDFLTLIDRYLAGDLSDGEVHRLTAMTGERGAFQQRWRETLQLESLLREGFAAIGEGGQSIGADSIESLMESADLQEEDFSALDLLLAGELSQNDVRQLHLESQTSECLRNELVEVERLERMLVETFAQTSHTSSAYAYPGADRIDRYLAGDLDLNEQAEFLAEAYEHPLMKRSLESAREFELLMRESFAKMASFSPAMRSTASDSQAIIPVAEEMIDRFVAGSLEEAELQALQRAAAKSGRVRRQLEKAHAFEALMQGALRNMSAGSDPAEGTGVSNSSDRLRALPSGKSRSKSRGRFGPKRSVLSSSYFQLATAAALLVAVGVLAWQTDFLNMGDSEPDSRSAKSNGSTSGDSNLVSHETSDGGRELANDNLAPSEASDEGSASTQEDVVSHSPTSASHVEQPKRDSVEDLNHADPEGAVDSELVSNGDNHTPSKEVDSSQPEIEKNAASGNAQVTNEDKPNAPDEVKRAPTESASAPSLVLDEELRKARKAAIPIALEEVRKRQRDDGTFRIFVDTEEEDAKRKAEEKERRESNKAWRQLLDLHVDAMSPMAVSYNARCVRALMAEDEVTDETIQRAIKGVTKLYYDVVLFEGGRRKFLTVYDISEMLMMVEESMREYNSKGRMTHRAFKDRDERQLVQHLMTALVSRTKTNTGIWPPSRGLEPVVGDVLAVSTALRGFHAIDLLRGQDAGLNPDRYEEEAIDEALARCSEFLLTSQNSAGAEHTFERMVSGKGRRNKVTRKVEPLEGSARGWNRMYRFLKPKDDKPTPELANGIVTAEAVHALLLIQEMVSGATLREWKRNGRDVDAAALDGLCWLDKYFRVDAVPQSKAGKEGQVLKRFHYRYLASVADVLSSSGDYQLQGKPWFVEFNRYLLEQQKDGSWIDAKAPLETLLENKDALRVSPKLRHAHALLAIKGRRLTTPEGKSLTGDSK